jgi:S-DNA-T family DNA segregation ATPase FtsK/SpoIIIE
VDGWAALRRDFEGLDEDIQHLAGSGLAYGIHVVITANRWAEMRPALRDNIGTRLELRLNDPIESEVGRRQAEAVPADVPGRGLTKDALHFQVALPDAEMLAEAGRRWEGDPAPPVPVLPLRVLAEELEAPPGPAIPIAIDEMGSGVASLDLTGADPHFLVLGDSEAGKTNLLRVIARAVAERGDPGRARLAIVDYRRGLLDLSQLPHVQAYAAGPAMVTDLVATLRSELTARLPGPGATRDELMRGPSWSGPRHLLLVDDYDLVPGIDNPLLPLMDLLAHGRDIGLHVILARRVAGTARSAFEQFYQRLVELRPPGIVMSGDPSEGALLAGVRAAALPPGRGYLVRRDRRPTLVQTALAPDTAPPAELKPLHSTMGGTL